MVTHRPPLQWEMACAGDAVIPTTAVAKAALARTPAIRRVQARVVVMPLRNPPPVPGVKIYTEHDRLV
jgi:hypothetical protein